MMDTLRQEAVEAQLTVLIRLRDETLGEHTLVCVKPGCYVPKNEHQGITTNRVKGHYPQFWSIEQAIMKLKAELAQSS